MRPLLVNTKHTYRYKKNRHTKKLDKKNGAHKYGLGAIFSVNMFY